MFDTGTSITLTAKPDAGSVFTQWSGCDQTDTNTCTIEMTAAKAVTATFKKSSNAEIIVSWDNGIWYWDVAASQWTQMEDSATDGDIAAGEFTGDDIADVASSWPSGLWYQDGDTLEWTRVTRSAATRLTAGDITGDGLSEIIGSWDSGLWYRNVALSTWNLITPFYGGAPLVGDIAAGDFTDDGRADVAFIFLSDIILIDMTINRTIPIQDRTGVVPKSVTTGDVTGDGRDEIIVSFDDGIWYWDVTAQQWTQMTSYVTDGDIAAGDFNSDGFTDVASIWPSGLWYQDGANLAWTKIPVDASDGPSGVPNRLTAGEVTEPPSGDLVKVFVTSVPSTGNLGGLAGADQFCETRAAAADLSGTGTWTAWLSDDAEDAIGRIPDGQYTLVDGTVIADDKNDLTDSMLNAAINLDEFGGGAGASSVWTGTQPDGTSVPPDSVFGKSSNCSNWTSSEQETSCTAGGDDNCAVRGNRSSMDATWTFVGTPGTSGALTGCSVPNSLYCFGSE
jgi:hypothetical protein